MIEPRSCDQDFPRAGAAPEITFLKAVASGDARAIASLTLGRRLDFAALAEFLVDERLGVYVHARLAELKLLALLPRQVAEPICWQHAEQQQRNARLLALLDEVQEAFAEAGIEVLVLKGLPMSERFWGGIDRRFSLDLDLLVRRAQFRAATSALVRCGFSTPHLVPQPDRLALRHSHALELNRDGLSLDLHWTLRNRPGLAFDLDAPWVSATSCRLDGIDCRVPGDEELLVMLLTGLASDLERGHHRLRSFWDVYLMLKAMPQTAWCAFCAGRAGQGLSVLLLNLLALVLWRLDCADELPVLARIIADSDDRLVGRDLHAARGLLARTPQRVANRQWFARLLPVPTWRYWMWWSGTLPVRFLLGRHI